MEVLNHAFLLNVVFSLAKPVTGSSMCVLIPERGVEVERSQGHSCHFSSCIVINFGQNTDFFQENLCCAEIGNESTIVTKSGEGTV